MISTSPSPGLSHSNTPRDSSAIPKSGLELNNAPADAAVATTLHQGLELRLVLEVKLGISSVEGHYYYGPGILRARCTNVCEFQGITS